MHVEKAVQWKLSPGSPGAHNPAIILQFPSVERHRHLASSLLTKRRNPGSNFPETDMPHEKFQPCIDACFACATACDHCAASCLDEQDVKRMAPCIKLDMDCAQICRLAASYMARGSRFAQALCRLCGEICETCAEECAQHQMDHCQRCANACRRCAEECQKMAQMA